jgi:mannosyltransferase
MSVMSPTQPAAPVDAAHPARPGVAALVDRFGWILPVLVTAVVVRYQAARPQLWRDELATWWAASRSPAGLDRLTSHIDAVFIPYYKFMHVWIAVFGDSTLSMRTPSMIAAVATAGVVAVLGRVLGSSVAGVFGGLLFAALPSVSRYGQEARPYALAAFGATTATLLLLLALRHMKWWYWAGYAVALCLAGSMHMIALLVLAGHAVAVLRAAFVRRSWAPLLWAGAAAVIAVAPVVPLLLLGHQQAKLQLGSRTQPPDAFAMTRVPDGVIGSGMVGGAVFALALIGALLATGRIPGGSDETNDRRYQNWALLGLMTLAPVAAFLIVAQVTPVYTLRYVFFLAAPAALLAGRLLSSVKLPGAVAALLLIAFLGLPDQDTARLSHEARGSKLINYRRAAALIAAHQQPGDAIVYGRTGWQFVDIAMEYYLRGKTPTDILAANTRDAAGSYWAPLVPDPAAALAHSDRVWWVDPSNLSTHKFDAVPAPLLTKYHVADSWTVSGIRVQLYQRG